MAESFLSELKRRRVVRAAGLYLVAAWVAVQVVVTIGPILNLPSATARWVVVLAAIGFPIALALTWIYERTAQGLVRDESVRSAGVRNFSRIGLALVILAAVGISAWVLTRTRGQVSANVIAIAPFRVPASLPDLREGMIDLLGIRLTGEAGPRAVDTRTLLAAWRREAGAELPDLELTEALKVARAVGAGALLVGEITPLGENVTLSAQLLDAKSGAERGNRESVTGRVEDLPILVDALAKQLLLTETGQSGNVAELTSSFPALHSFLAGKSAFRRGELTQALGHFESALQHDSMFAQAALNRFLVSSWLPTARAEEFLERAHRLSDRLNRLDRLQLYSYSSRGIDVASIASAALLATDSALMIAPDRPELWFDQGDSAMHWGMLMGVPDWKARAAQSFDEALRLDSTMAIALEHRAALAAVEGDTLMARQLAERYYQAAPTSELNDELRWVVGVMGGDSNAVRAVRRRMMGSEISRERIAAAALLHGVSVGDAELGSAIGNPSRARLPSRLTARLQTGYALGRPAMIEEVVQRDATLPLDQSITVFLLEELLASGITTPSVVNYIEKRIAEVGPLDQVPSAAQPDVSFYSGLWQYLHKHDAAAARASLTRLRAPELRSDDEARQHAIYLDAIIAGGEKSPNARAIVMRADSVSRLGPIDMPSTMNFWLARSLESVGEPAKALAAVRRRQSNYVAKLTGLASILREEGRLAELNGDVAGAIRAYRHFLALRYRPAGEFEAQSRAVQAALARLVDEPGARGAGVRAN